MSLPARLTREARSLDPRLLDAGLALALTVWALVEPGALRDPARALVLVAMTVAIAWRRRSPVTVLVVEVAGVALLPNRLNLPAGIAVLIAAYSAALYSDRRVLVPALLVAVAAWLLAFGGRAQIPSGLVPFLLLAPVWLAGSAMRHREQRAEASAARTDRLEQEREASLRAERARIARELHDVVTHAVSVMVLQTGAARQIMSQDPRRSRVLLESVEASGRSALEELRRLLDLLSDDERVAPLAPQPGVTEIPSLVDQVQHAGLSVELRVEGQPRVVPRGIAVAAYRIVQEALTNVLKHAGGAPTSVVLAGPTPSSSSRFSTADRRTGSMITMLRQAAGFRGCASERRCTVARSTFIRSPTAGTQSAPAYRSSRGAHEPSRAHRRRRRARPRGAPDDLRRAR